MAGTSLSQKLFVIDVASLQKAASVYRAVNHSLRLQIIEMIHKAGTIHVTAIIQQLKLEQAVISAHSKRLRDAKSVISGRKGGSFFYSINSCK